MALASSSCKQYQVEPVIAAIRRVSPGMIAPVTARTRITPPPLGRVPARVVLGGVSTSSIVTGITIQAAPQKVRETLAELLSFKICEFKGRFTLRTGPALIVSHGKARLLDMAPENCQSHRCTSHRSCYVEICVRQHASQKAQERLMKFPSKLLDSGTIAGCLLRLLQLMHSL